MSDRIVTAQDTGEDEGDDPSLESSEIASHPDMELDQDMDANYCFADIYVRNAPSYLKGFLGSVQEPIHGELRDPNTGLLAFEDGVCEISATSSFLTVAMSASDDKGLDQIRGYFEEKLRSLSDQQIIEFDWRKH
ncbi:DUF2218 domain-containing protein [Thalassospira sp. SM2505]|jgi:hypothetical protein|uniref:Uncharacterized protein n=1 Tax=Thalassospira profundimaris TaxID=502049 RepID=A0A367WZ99_9PROT|nr:DUF2218 domain-containing protein [Thalassospira profundimaris]RCK45732.1 hypothetical protein TH30_11345 [Thalassospira profundimaris]